MGLKKGQTNNPNGRKKGVPNKSTQAIKDILTPIMTGQLETLEADLESLKQKSLKDYLDAVSKFMPYVAAKHSEVKAQITDQTIRVVDDTE